MVYVRVKPMSSNIKKKSSSVQIGAFGSETPGNLKKEDQNLLTTQSNSNYKSSVPMYHSSFPLEIQLHYGNAEQQRKEEPKCHNHRGNHPEEALVEAEVIPDKICHGGVCNTIKELSIVITIL